MLQATDFFLALDGKLRIAREMSRNEDGSITVDLYRNPKDYSLGVVMERDLTCWMADVNRPPPNDRDCFYAPRRGSSGGAVSRYTFGRYGHSLVLHGRPFPWLLRVLIGGGEGKRLIYRWTSQRTHV